MIVTGTLMFSCKNNNETNRVQQNTGDSTFLASWNALKNNQNKFANKSKSDTTVDGKLAQACIDEYYKKMSTMNTGWDTVNSKPKLSMKTSFNFADFQNWISKLGGFADDIKICYGIYTEEYCNKYYNGDKSFVGRLTVFIWPYKNGKPLTKSDYISTNGSVAPADFGEPYNLGGIEP